MRAIVSAAALVLMLTGGAVAQSTTSPSTGTAPGAAPKKMSQADCSARWTRLDTSKAGSLSRAQAQPAVTNFNAADSNRDGKLSRAEFLSACQKGLVTASKSMGTGSRGLSGNDDAQMKSPSGKPGSTSK